MFTQSRADLSKRQRNAVLDGPDRESLSRGFPHVKHGEPVFARQALPLCSFVWGLLPFLLVARTRCSWPVVVFELRFKKQLKRCCN